jgi:ABC-type multidrug transport system fused ATPase/permease subunit
MAANSNGLVPTNATPKSTVSFHVGVTFHNDTATPTAATTLSFPPYVAARAAFLQSTASSATATVPLTMKSLRSSSVPHPTSASVTGVGRISAPQLLTVPSYRHGVETYSREQWAATSADKAVALLLDPASPVGEADLALWTDQQLTHLVDTIESHQWPVMMRKSGMFGQHVNGVDITFKNVFYRKNNVQRLNNISGYIRAGSMVAVVGAPDAGITTFFDVLTNRQRGILTRHHMHDMRTNAIRPSNSCHVYVK